MDREPEAQVSECTGSNRPQGRPFAAWQPLFLRGVRGGAFFGLRGRWWGGVGEGDVGSRWKGVFGSYTSVMLAFIHGYIRHHSVICLCLCWCWCRDLEEERSDVRKVGHMGNFYKNLMKANVAFGGSSDTAGGTSTTAATAGENGEEEGRGGEEESHVEGESPRGGDQDQATVSKSSSAAADQDDSLTPYEKLRQEALKARTRLEQQQQQQQQQKQHEQEGPAATSTPGRPQQEGIGTASRNAVGDGAEASGRVTGSTAHDTAAGQSTGLSTDAAAAAGPVKRRNDDSSVSAARERYLARKRQQLEQI